MPGDGGETGRAGPTDGQITRTCGPFTAEERPPTNRLESSRSWNPQGVAQNEPIARANKGKEPIFPDHSDHQADDEFSSDSSPLPRCSSPLSNAEAESRKRPPCQSSRAMSGTRRRMPKEDTRDRPRSQLAPEHIRSGRSPSYMQPFIPLSRDPTTCCPVPWASIF